jgi:broad specificity phosphatase PhoE
MQAAALGGALAQHAGDDDGVAGDGRDGVNAYDLLVSSPLSRCMQTAALTFGGRSDRDITLLHALTEKVDSYGDVGRPLAQRLASHKELEGWSWHADTSEHDCADVQLWSTTHAAMSPYGPVAGRPYEDIHVSAAPPRLSRVWSWLSSRSEQRIVVVSHSKLLGFPDRDYGVHTGHGRPACIHSPRP